MAIVNISGWETGSVSGTNFEGTSAATGTASVVTSPVRSGQYALRINPTTTGLGYNSFARIAANGTNNPTSINIATCYFRFYFRYATKPASNSEEICYINDTAPAPKLMLRINSSGQLMAFDNTGTNQIGSTGSTVLMQDTWYLIEISVGTGTSAAFEVRLAADDGSESVTEISGTGNLTTLNNSAISLGKRNDRNGNSVDFYYDDLSISDSDFPGPGRVARLDPISDSADVWTTGTFANIDDFSSQAGNDGDTTYITTSTNTDAHIPNFTSNADAGITGVINAVKSYLLTRDESQTVAHDTMLQVNGAGTNTTNLDGGATYSSRCQILTDGYTPSDVFTLRVRHNQPQVRPLRCTVMAIMVDYTPAPKSIPPVLRRRSTRFFRQYF